MKTADTLRTKAASLDKKIAHCMRERLTNTRKRAEEDAGMRREGRKYECMRAVMLELATMHEAGSIPAELAGLRDVCRFESVVGCVLSTERQIAEYPHNNLEHMRDRWTPEERAIHPIIQAAGFGIGESQAEKLHRLQRDIKLRKIPGFFATKPPAVRQVIQLADLEDGMTVLEPSAGNGAIADAARDAGARVDVCEINSDLREILRLKGYTVLPERDCLDLTPENGLYDRVCMNAPFENGADIDHVTHAYKLLKPGGVLVAIMSPAWEFHNTRKAEEFRAWFHGVGDSCEDLPSGFAEMTGCTGKLVRISKPAARVAPPIAPIASVAPPIAGQADPEFQSRLDAQRVTLEFSTKSSRNIDAGLLPIQESPLFGGPAQGNLFS